MQIVIPELNLKSDFGVATQVDDFVSDLEPSVALEDAVGLPILRATLFTEALPFVLVVQVEDEFADPSLCEDMKAYIVTVT